MPWSARPHQASAGVAKKQYMRVVVPTRSRLVRAPLRICSYLGRPPNAPRSEGDWTRQMAGPGHRPNALG